MSTTSPASTAELQEYCLRKLGKPVVHVNLADEQMDDMIAESVQLFQEYHFDGTERAFLVEQVAASTLTFASSATGTFVADETITGGSSNATAIVHERSSATVLSLGATDEIDLTATAIDVNGTIDVSGASTFGGVLSIPDGSAGSPSITNTGDTNCGLYFSAADTLAFTAGGTAQFTMADGVIAPVTDSDVDLGTSSLEFKDLYLDGTAHVDTLDVDVNGTVAGTLGVTGIVTASTSANITQVAITSSSNAVAWDAAAAANAYHVTTENTTFSAPSNAVEGAIISVEIAQGSTPRTIGWNTVFEFAASTAPTVTATANKTDIFSFRYNGSVWQEIGRVQNLAQT